MLLFAATLLLGSLCFARVSATLELNAEREIKAKKFGRNGAPLGHLVTQLVSMHHQQRPMRCMSLLTDSYYAQYFTDSKINEETPILVDEIDYQHQSLRNSSAFEALARAKNEGCHMVAIFFHNGKKLAQLLRAADRLRLLHSKVFLILPFNFKLYILRMHSFWGRFLNVIFIRNTSQRPLRQENGAYSKDGCLELSTVSFPTPVDPDHPETWLPLSLATWCGGRFYNSSGKLFSDKTKNLNGEVLRIAFFEHAPAVVKLRGGDQKNRPRDFISSSYFTGVEIQILSLLSKDVNFTPLLKEVPGNRSEGVVEALTFGFADVALGSLAYVPYFQTASDLSDPYATYCYTFLTPEVIGDLSWLTLLLPFDKVLWAFSAAALFLGWISMNAFARLQADSSQMIDLLSSFFNTLSMQLMVPLPRAPKGWPLRLLFCSFWVHCLLLSVSYRASFASQLAKPAPRIAIDTVEKLARAKHLQLFTYEYFAKDMFNATPDSSSKIIGERIQEVQMTINEIADKIKLGKVAFFGNTYLLNSIKAAAEKSLQGKHSVHLNEECVVSLPVSLGLARNSALAPHLNKVVKRAVENGLVTKWLQESSAIKSVSVGTEAQPALVDLPKMISVFAAIGCGLLLAAAVFLLELLGHSYQMRRAP